MKKRLGLIIDQEKCIGCEACTVACKLENNSSSYWIQVETQNVNQKDTPAGIFPELSMTFLPHLCNHCDYPPCVDSCPEHALIKRKDGPVILDQERCTGCQACMTTCPYGVISFNQEKEIVEKCHLCVHRIDQGLEPFCVICCEGQAIKFGDFNDPHSNVSKLITEIKSFQLKPDQETGSCIYYLPPKPKKRL